MSEQRWHSCDEPDSLLFWVREVATQRKLRLFLAGCCEHVGKALGWSHFSTCARAGAIFADQEMSPVDLRVVWRQNSIPQHWADFDFAADPLSLLLFLLASDEITPQACWGCTQRIWEAGPKLTGSVSSERAVLCDLVRDIFSNPFSPVSFQSEWTNWKARTISHLAGTIYHERRYEILPILADALEEAGCDDPEILNHCRGPGPHVKGCWVVDLILGKA